MDKLNASGVQTYTAIFIGSGSAVFNITLDGAADFGKLTPYLMMAAGFQINFQEEIIVRFGK